MRIGNRGLSLLEILFATLIFVLALAALMNGIIAALYLINLSQDQTLANTDLTNMMEWIKTTPFNDMMRLFPDSLADGPATNSYPFYLGGYSLNNEHITVTYADLDSDPLEIKVNLSWQDSRGRNYNISAYTFKTR